MTGRVPSSSPAPLSASAHTSGGQRQLACDDIVLSCSRLQIADCRFQTMGADFRCLGTQISDFRFQMGKGWEGGATLHMREKVVEACRRPFHRGRQHHLSQNLVKPAEHALRGAADAIGSTSTRVIDLPERALRCAVQLAGAGAQSRSSAAESSALHSSFTFTQGRCW